MKKVTNGTPVNKKKGGKQEESKKYQVFYDMIDASVKEIEKLKEKRADYNELSTEYGLLTDHIWDESHSLCSISDALYALESIDDMHVNKEKSIEILNILKQASEEDNK